MQDVRAVQSKFEAEGRELVALHDTAKVLNATELNRAYAAHATNVLKAFWALPDQIVKKYADGWLDDATELAYPDWWLRSVGYTEGPPPPPPGHPHAEVTGHPHAEVPGQPHAEVPGRDCSD